MLKTNGKNVLTFNRPFVIGNGLGVFHAELPPDWEEKLPDEYVILRIIGEKIAFEVPGGQFFLASETSVQKKEIERILANQKF